MKRPLIRISALALLALPMPALAEERDNLPTSVEPVAKPNSNPTNREVESIVIPITTGAPNSRTMAGFQTSSLQFSSEQGDTAASLAFSFDLNSYQPDQTARNQKGFFVVSRTKLGVTATVPIDGDGNASRLFAGDSLVSGSKLRLSVTHFSASLGTGGGTRPLIGQALKQCVVSAVGSMNSTKEPFATLLGQIDYVVAHYGPGILVNFQSVFADANVPEVTKKCLWSSEGADLPNARALVRTYTPENLSAFDSGFVSQRRPMTFLGVDASIGRDDHTYLDQSNFKLLTEPRTSWEVSAFYGWIGSNGRFSIRAKAVYGQNYTDNEEAEICRTVSVPAGPECINGPDGAPLRNRTGLLSLEARQLVTVNDSTTIAMAPQITYRTEDKNFGVEVPIYLAPDDKGQLSGGIKAAYNSKGDEFSIGLFVGVPFSIFYN